MKVLVTGGAGFIGSHVVDELIRRNHRVVVVDNFSLGNEKNLAHLKGDENIEIHNRSICDDMKDVMDGVDIVFHLAAIPRVQYSIKYPVETNKVNVDGTLNLLLCCQEMGVKRFVFSSSSSVYGDQDRLPLIETMKPNPMSPYALQKLTGEHYCKLFHDIHVMETICLRYFNVFGPRQDPNGDYACLIPKFINMVDKNIRPTIYGDGEQTRDFTYVANVVDVNMKAGFTNKKSVFGEVFNIGNGKNISVNEITRMIIGNKKIKPVHLPPVIEPRHTLADISKAKKLLGWVPKCDAETGLKNTVEYFKPK